MGTRYKILYCNSRLYIFYLLRSTRLHAIDLLYITVVIQYAKFFPLSIVGILPIYNTLEMIRSRQPRATLFILYYNRRVNMI